MAQLDQLHRFIFNQQHIRGEIVRLDESLHNVVQSYPYPTPIQQLLCEMSAASSLLSAILKFEGEIGLQIQGNGTLKYAVINATHEQTYRGVARWDENITDLPHDFAELVGDAVLVLTITPVQGERYQGVVALDKPSLAECLEDYFTQSEQLATKVLLQTDFTDGARPKAAGLLLQVLPQQAETSAQHEPVELMNLWHLAATITAEEMFTLSIEDLLYRLYHEESVELFPAQDVRFACTCSRERSASALASIEKQELLNIINEQGTVNMNCQYCHAEYAFDAIDIEAIHAGNGVISGTA